MLVVRWLDGHLRVSHETTTNLGTKAIEHNANNKRYGNRTERIRGKHHPRYTFWQCIIIQQFAVGQQAREDAG